MTSAVKLLQGDCIERMAELEEGSVDAVVTDPPYGLTNRVPDEVRCSECRWVPGGSFGQGKPGEPCERCGASLSRTREVRGGFMGKNWDAPGGGSPRGAQAWHEAWAREAYRVLKPGGFLLCAGGTRTFHRLVCALEDAGFEIRDTIMHVYGSGFPKSLDVSKAIDKMAGAEREVVGPSQWGANRKPGHQSGNAKVAQLSGGDLKPHPGETAPATEEARQWAGFGTALKPSFEPWTLARKPLSEKSVAANVLKHGTGALNIDASRVGNEPTHRPTGNHALGVMNDDGWQAKDFVGGSASGRFPANLLLSHSPECQRVGTKRVKPSNGSGKASRSNEERATYCSNSMGAIEPANGSDMTYNDPDGTEEVEAYSCVEGCPVAEMDRQSGVSPSNKRKSKGNGEAVGLYGLSSKCNNAGVNDSGGASRFFQTFEPDTGAGFLYCAKSSRRERNQGLEGLPEKPTKVTRFQNDQEGCIGQRIENGEVTGPRSDVKPAANNHPTVKPIALMRYLVKMVCPPGGTVLDCFLGSGSTGAACVYEGFDFIGIEQDSSYLEIAERRIAHAQEETKDKLFS